MKLFNLLIFSIHLHSATILIDPGHGGKEVGATVNVDKKEVYEKDLTLKFSKLLKQHLSKKHKVYLTRDKDQFVSLEHRAELADEVKADLFISIHFNASKNKNAKGAEIYYLDNHKDKAVKKIEKFENVGLEEKETSIVHKILIDLAIKLTQKESKKIAIKANEELKVIYHKFKVKNRGVKPGLFFVLALSKRPGLLIEPGFMSNDKEFKILNKTDYLNEYAKAIATTLENFKAP